MQGFYNRQEFHELDFLHANNGAHCMKSHKKITLSLLLLKGIFSLVVVIIIPLKRSF